MLAYIGRRMIIMPFVLVGILLIIFGMLQLLSPQQKLATFIKSPAELKNNDVEVLIEKYGLNDPIWARLGRWLNDVIHFNFGYSESASMPAAEAFLQFFPVSMELALWSALPIILGGIWLGTVAAVNHNNVIDHVTRVFSP
ncbi:ABC transporter permease, partial [Candidatus Bipolaricaulota bacterium]|nr:ABC transporter permease [Candidatus Bipolaricaulota bacterium]